MELLVACVEALGAIVSPIAHSITTIIVVGIITKTFLIYNDAESEDLKDWFDFLKIGDIFKKKKQL